MIYFKVWGSIFYLTTSISLIYIDSSTRGKRYYSSSTILLQKQSNKRLSKVDRSKFIIKSPLDEIIVGLLLGDGHIQKRYINGNSRFIYAQSSLRLQHLNYFNHILELFRPYLSKNFNLKNRNFTDKRTNKIYS